MDPTQVCFTLTAELMRRAVTPQHSFPWVWTSFHPHWPSQHVCYASTGRCGVHVLRRPVFWAVDESWWLKLVRPLLTLPLGLALGLLFALLRLIFAQRWEKKKLLGLPVSCSTPEHDCSQALGHYSLSVFKVFQVLKKIKFCVLIKLTAVSSSGFQEITSSDLRLRTTRFSKGGGVLWYAGSTLAWPSQNLLSCTKTYQKHHFFTIHQMCFVAHPWLLFNCSSFKLGL